MPREPSFRPTYTVPELARIAGTTPRDLRDTLNRHAIKVHRKDARGRLLRTGRVWISDIRAGAPELLASIILVVKLRNAGLSSDSQPEG